MPKFIIFLIPLLLFTSINADDDPFLRSVRDKIRSIQPFTVDFIQQVYIEKEMELEEKGQILYQDHQHLLWEYRHPEPKFFLLTGSQYQFYLPEDRQLIRGQLSQNREQLIWHILFSGEKNRTIHCDAEKRKILIRGDDDALLLEIEFNPESLPVRVKQTDPMGSITLFLFRNYHPKAEISSGSLRIKVAPDTEIIDENGAE